MLENDGGIMVNDEKEIKPLEDILYARTMTTGHISEALSPQAPVAPPAPPAPPIEPPSEAPTPRPEAEK